MLLQLRAVLGYFFFFFFFYYTLVGLEISDIGLNADQYFKTVLIYHLMHF